jgi:NhaA family Na+:H+ antiporter
MSASPSAGDDEIFGQLPPQERAHVLDALRNETVGGILLLVGAVLALVLANSPAASGYEWLSDLQVGPVIEVGPITLDLHLSLATWAADGLLAIFFFVAGVELRHELELGTLADPRKAAVPLAAAIGGMVLPAAIYFAVNSAMADGEPGGWGIPMATDIAFALAVLAVVGRRLPVAMRAFLLSLAVVDDLGAIIVIAIFYSKGFFPAPFFVFVLLIGLYWLLQRLRVRGWWWYLGIAVLAWAFLHESGVHATIAGVACGLLTRVRPDPGEEESPGHRAEHAIRPISAGFAVPVFAFFAAGVSLSSGSVDGILSNPVAIGVFLGLVVGKPIGVFVTAWLTARFTRARLSEDILWSDVLAVGYLAGIGFTVSLLIGELAFYQDEGLLSAAKLAILTASAVSAVLATVALVSRNRHYRAAPARGTTDAPGPEHTG